VRVESGGSSARSEIHLAHDLAETHLAQPVGDPGPDAADVGRSTRRGFSRRSMLHQRPIAFVASRRGFSTSITWRPPAARQSVTCASFQAAIEPMPTGLCETEPPSAWVAQATSAAGATVSDPRPPSTLGMTTASVAGYSCLT